MSRVPKSIRKELVALAARPESKIDFSDLPPRPPTTGAVRSVESSIALSSSN